MRKWRRVKNCDNGHWFAYWFEPGTSSPICVREGCNAVNPDYYPEDDTHRPRFYCPAAEGDCTFRACPVKNDPDHTGPCPLPRLQAPPHWRRERGSP